VPVSSILPPGCKVITREEGLSYLSPGEIVFCVLSKNSSKVKGDRILSAIGCAIPDDPSKIGYIFEHKSSEDEVQGMVTAKELAIEMYESVNGSEPKEVIAISKEAVADEDGVWTTVVAAAVFITKDLHNKTGEDR
jgi:arginine decarboxylase